MTFSIKPGQGAAELHLGMSRDELVATLGEPAVQSETPQGTKLSFPERGVSAVLDAGGQVGRLYFAEACEVTCGPLRMGMALDEFPDKFTGVARRRERTGADGQAEVCFDVAGLTAFVTGPDQKLRGLMVIPRETDGDEQELLERDEPQQPGTQGADANLDPLDEADEPVDTRALLQESAPPPPQSEVRLDDSLSGETLDEDALAKGLDADPAGGPQIQSDVDQLSAHEPHSAPVPAGGSDEQLSVTPEEPPAPPETPQPAEEPEAAEAPATPEPAAHANGNGSAASGGGLREAIDGVVGQMKQAGKATLRTVDAADVPSADDRRPMPNGGELPINYLFQLSPGYGDERCHLEMSRDDIVYELGRPNGERDSSLRFTGRGMEVRFDKDGNILAITWCNEKSNRFLGPVRPAYVAVEGLRLGDPSADIRENLPEAARHQDFDSSTGVYQLPGLEIHHVRGEVVQFTVYHKSGRPTVLDEEEF